MHSAGSLCAVHSSETSPMDPTHPHLLTEPMLAWSIVLALTTVRFLQFLYFLSGHAPWSDILHIIIYSIRSTRRLRLCMCLGRLHGPSERWDPRIEGE
jgi:hypothetical protein